MPLTETISSPANPLLKEVRKAINRGALMDRGSCAAETFHLLDEALQSDCRVQAVIAGESVRDAVEMRIENRTDIRMVVAPDKLLDASSQGVVALVEPPEWNVQQVFGGTPLVLVIDGIQDPGNLGTILRSAEAFAASGLLLLKGSVNPFNPKAVRASSGSIFRVPFVSGLDEEQVAAVLRESGAEIHAAVPGNGLSPSAADLTRPCAIIIGSEGRGVSAGLRSIAAELSIPTRGVESLNAAISAAVLLYEARRQRNSQIR